MAPRSRYKRLLAAGSASLALVTAGVALAAPAEAATGRIGRTYTLNVRSAPQVSASIVSVIPRGGSLNLTCYVRGATVQGPWGASNIWDRVDLGGGRVGYAADALVITGSSAPIVPACGSAPSAPAPQPPASSGSREARALAWAQSQVGSRGWGSWCQKFVGTAYPGSRSFGSAIEAYRWQAANGRIHRDQNPPAGAIVYYSSPRWDAGYGHVAIATGDGHVITTLEAGQPVSVKALTWPPGFLGWAYAP